MSVSYEMLLHPELLPNEKLVQIIQERHLRVENLVKMSRPKLLELFHQFCIPFGQRKYRDSGRGKMLNKVRQTCSDSTITLHALNGRTLHDSRLSYSDEITTTNNNINKRSFQFNEDRLKPSLDTLSGHIKRITLDKKLPPKGNESKRKSSIDSLTLSSDCPAPKKERKHITWP